MNVLITGAGGYLGQQLVLHLLHNTNHTVIAADIRNKSPFEAHPNLQYIELDVRSNEARQYFEQYNIDVVVHLASIVTPGKKSNREFEYSVDVLGTKNILEACVQTDVKRIVVSSSGAAYGYYANNAEWIEETDPIRGNEAFAYSYHKRLVEEMLDQYRTQYPQLEQTIFRIGTILGENVRNQITNLFEQNIVLGVANSKSPFVFIWDQDVIACFAKAIDSDITGIFNLAGDGAVTIDELGILLNKKVVKIPATMIKGSLFILKRLKLSQYGEEQVDFLRYRPVLDNKRLKEVFQFTPKKSSLEVFKYYWQHRLKEL
ncbi:UDP-glucose 4-epimerase [Solibacillus isronensis B3W22]|uniref:UDP-glucose 4-epimerase n=1 Tax=Solibacillus isronensis B3W22 TaxID=1224748 RepID=K1KW06_9BACL|nr:SDR family oxidoreductase [Solibacillus isronensis]AMO85273.1 epimerase [Solibacillus silvestris]EKB44077.1 UDP-glucose 4-epimerase [Solibacillus isronensis B3W22]